MEKINRTDRVTNEAVLHRVKDESNVLLILYEGRLPGSVISCVGTAF